MSVSSFLPRLARVRPRPAFLLGLLLVVAATTLPFVTHGAVTAQTVSGEAALEAKADKLLKYVYHVATQSEPGNANEPAHADAVQELDELSHLTRVSRNADETLKVGMIVQLNGGDSEELKAAGFAVGAVVGDIATVEVDASRLPELASLASVKRMWASVRRRPLNDRGSARRLADGRGRCRRHHRHGDRLSPRRLHRVGLQWYAHAHQVPARHDRV
jgi:hypothetical protein